MSSDRKPGLALPFAVALVLSVGYVGSYYAMVIRRVDKGGPRKGEIVAWYAHYPGAETVTPPFSVHAPESVVAKLFAPIHWLDRHAIRRGVWDREWPPPEYR